MYKPTTQEIEQLYQKLKKDAESGGYHLNPDEKFIKELVEGLLINQNRFGYQACPCRLAAGKKVEDIDIICPCDYRDPDLTDHDACYCGLYVSGKILSGEKKLKSIPERRNSSVPANAGQKVMDGLSQPVWRCQVCGYLCARPEAPETCPICKVPKDRFERFM